MSEATRSLEEKEKAKELERIARENQEEEDMMTFSSSEEEEEGDDDGENSSGDDAKYDDHSQNSDCVECTGCGSGQYVSNLCSNNRNTLCSDCPTGQFSNSTGFEMSCEECPTGLYQDQNGQHSCLECSNGRYMSNTEKGQIECEACPSGYFGNEGSCKICPYGKYQENVGETQCEACPSGYFGDTDTSTSLDNCKEFFGSTKIPF